MALLGSKKSAPVVEPIAPSARAEPQSKLAQAKAALAVADEAQRLLRVETATVQERQRRAERELSELDRNADQSSDVNARLDRRIVLDQELAAASAMLPSLTQRHREADRKQGWARQEVQAVEHQIARLRQSIDDDTGRIRRQQQLVEEARGQLSGAEYALKNLEQKAEARKTALIELAAA